MRLIWFAGFLAPLQRSVSSDPLVDIFGSAFPIVLGFAAIGMFPSPLHPLGWFERRWG